MADADTPVHWIEIKLVTDGEIAEALAEVLGRFVANGVVVEAETCFNPKTQENEPTGNIAVYGYLPDDNTMEEKRQALEEALRYLGMIAPMPPIQYTPIHDENWMSAWKAHYQPIQVGKNLLILPAWRQPDEGEIRLVVRINPAMAFGTGAHPSTQLCLRLMEVHLAPGEPVIDLGCGSGILSITALLMGASHALAVDIDEEALVSTRENAELNRIDAARLEVSLGSVNEILSGNFSRQEAPLVLVNILAPVIIRLLGQGLGALVSPDGALLLSGILAEQEPDVLDAATKAGFSLIERMIDGDWVGLMMRKSHD